MAFRNEQGRTVCLLNADGTLVRGPSFTWREVAEHLLRCYQAALDGQTALRSEFLNDLEQIREGGAHGRSDGLK
jgi:hypothetical protein